MPIYLSHGFRWPRDGFTGIRVHAIVNDLEDVSAEYIQNAHSRANILESFRSKFPTLMTELEKPGRAIDFLEQYDPHDESPSATTQPWAFVCDRIVMIAGGGNAEYYAGQLLHKGGMRGIIGGGGGGGGGSGSGTGGGAGGSGGVGRSEAGSTVRKQKERKKTLPMTIAAPFNTPANISALSVNMEEVMADGPGMSTEAWQALADLRDQIAEGEKIGWWVVYNGDPDRAFDEDEEGGEKDEGAAGQEEDTTPAASPQKETGTPKLPTGGRMPPPVPPANLSKTQRSSTHSTLTSSTAGTTPSSRERPISDPMGNTATPDTSKSKSISRGQGLKMFFRKKS